MTVLREYEVKILNVTADAATRAVRAAGGVLAADRALRQRWNYDVPGQDIQRWVRLRTEPASSGGGELTFKHVDNAAEIGGVRECQTRVSSVDWMREILAELGHHPRSYQETYRTRFQVGLASVDLDEWPGVPPWLEIEGPDEATVLDAITKLGYRWEDTTTATTVQVYQQYGIDLMAHEWVTFEHPPLVVQGVAR